jgi:putative ATP-dependent endonuclease of OLD family
MGNCFLTDRIGIDSAGNQFLAYRTIVEENLIRKTYKKKRSFN